MLETYTLASGIAVVCCTISHPQPAVADGSFLPIFIWESFLFIPIFIYFFKRKSLRLINNLVENISYKYMYGLNSVLEKYK